MLQTTVLAARRIALQWREVTARMTNVNGFCKMLVASAALAVAPLVAGCHASHPDDSQAVYAALDKNDLASVIVNQDRGSGVIKLTGIVGDQARKDHAAQLAQQAAPGYRIDNQLRVDQENIFNSPSTPSGSTPNPADNRTASAVSKAKPKK